MKSRNVLSMVLLIAFVSTIPQLLPWQETRQGRSMMMPPEERAKRLKEQLSLSDEQTKKATKIFEESQKKMTGMRDSLQGDFEVMRAAMQQMQAKQDSTIEAMLNKDQLKKYEELKQERQKRMQRTERRRSEQ
ncbi:MAG: hypothetical protein ACRDGA_00485 [Bacteroidota bacterium]